MYFHHWKSVQSYDFFANYANFFDKKYKNYTIKQQILKIVHFLTTVYTAYDQHKTSIKPRLGTTAAKS